MRVTNRMLTLGFLRNLGITTTRLQTLQDQLATGKRIRRPSDDPTTLPKVLFLRDALRQIDQYQANIDDSKNLLALAEKAVASAVKVVQEIRQDAVAGANDTLTQGSRDALADKAESLLGQLVAIANSSYEGRFLFGGFRTLTSPFVLSGGEVRYQGDLGTLTREIEGGTVIDVSIPGISVFMGNPYTVRGTTQPTGALGITGTFTVNGVGVTVAAADALEDIAKKINDANASALAYVDTSRRLVILQASSSSTTSLVETSGTPLQALGVLDALGQPLDATQPNNLFDTVLGLISDLRAGNVQNISATRIQQIDQALETLLSYQAQLGARWARTENTEERLLDFRVHLTDLLSKSEDVDIAEVIVGIQAEENVYRAALAAGARLIQPTLLDFLR